MQSVLIRSATRHPRLVMVVVALITVVALVQLPRIQVDTDPENMLRADEPVRITHAAVKEEFNLYDFLVVGIVHPETVFTPEILARVQAITEALHSMDGVIVDDILAPGEVDDIRPEEGGGIRVEVLMESAPETGPEAADVLVRIRENPILRGKLASDDGKAMALFIPLKSKDYAQEVGDKILALIEADHGDEEYFLAGQPVAQDTFGTAMFQQMALSAPVAFLLIYLLMLYFFRAPRVVAAPMVLAMIAVIWTMGLLVGLGFTVHIMSSMIPIFLIPAAVLDSIHILSSMHEKLRRNAGDVDGTITSTVGELFLPMTFTSLTTVVGFGALIVTPIPPVQVFGAFVAFGVFVAWLLSLVFLPAWLKLLPPDVVTRFGSASEGGAGLRRPLRSLLDFSLRARGPVIAALIVLMAIAGWGVTRIVVNDNPVNWFKAGSPLRVADRVLNAHLAGTYMAYLEVAAPEDQAFLDADLMRWVSDLQDELMAQENVGSVSSVVDVLRKVQFELLSRAEGSNSLADSREKIAQYLFLYEISGGSPDDLFKFITPGQDRVNLWVQMHNGDNQRVREVVEATTRWTQDHPAPAGITTNWAGLSYINVEWQDQMVRGMSMALAGSWLTVLVMVTLLFRSIRLGLLAVVPLTATILFTYGYVGLSGRNFDMPIAVLSSLSLGLSVDFAIHFIQRTRDLYRENDRDFGVAMDHFFGEPAQALARNVIVIALGFIPMFFATLMPYVTVGAFFVAIMLISGGATFLIMPAVLSLYPARTIAGRGSGPTARGST